MNKEKGWLFVSCIFTIVNNVKIYMLLKTVLTNGSKHLQYGKIKDLRVQLLECICVLYKHV